MEASPDNFHLFCSEGTQASGVWSYSYAPDPAMAGGWSTAPTVSAEASPPLIGGNNALSVAKDEQFGVNPGDTLQTFLERLSLSSHLGLFQVGWAGLGWDGLSGTKSNGLLPFGSRAFEFLNVALSLKMSYTGFIIITLF